MSSKNCHLQNTWNILWAKHCVCISFSFSLSSDMMILLTKWIKPEKELPKSLKHWITTCFSCSLPSAAKRDSGKQSGLWQATCSKRIVGMSYCTLNSWTRSRVRVPLGDWRKRQWWGKKGGWSRWSGLVEVVTGVVAPCAISAPWILMDSGQVCAQFINTPRYISRQSLSTCCLRKASMVLKPQSPSCFFQVSSSRASYTFPDMDQLSATEEGVSTRPSRRGFSC